MVRQTKRFKIKRIGLYVIMWIFGFFYVTFVRAQITTLEIPKTKQTSLELYVTAKEAYEMWKADPDKVKILDIRTPEEYIFVGHAPMAWNIPAFDQSYVWDAEKQQFPMRPNPDFIAKMKELFQPEDILLLTCRSGDRSALAVNELAKVGFTNAYTITDGFEGNIVNDHESVYYGLHMVNGWKNSGLPYTYKIDPNLMVISGVK
jgi:rhodanese-related sulfurtransferase